MGCLKGLGTAICAFLLFLSLTVFGVAYLVHNTVLDPDFVTEQVEKLDISEIARDAAEDLIGEQLPEEVDFLTEPVYEVIDSQEIWLKQQFNRAIYAVYDFLLGKTDQLQIVISVEEVKTEMKDSIWDALVEEAQDWLPEVVGQDLGPFIDENLDELADQIPLELLPPDVAEAPDERLRPYLQNYVLEIEAMLQDEMEGPEVTGLLEELLKPYYDEYFEDFIGEIPSEIVLNEDEIPDEVMDQLLLARQYIGYFQTGYWLLIVFMVVLALLIFLINRDIKATTRALGIDLLIFGILDLAGVLILRAISPVESIGDIPASLQTWITGVFNDVLNIMMTFSIIILAVGIVLLVVSIVVKGRRAEVEY